MPTISELLLPEFDSEIKKTKTMLQRVPSQPDFKPHEKSMPLGRLAGHVAELAGFGLTVITTPELDFAKSTYKPTEFESTAQLIKILEDGAAKVRTALASASNEVWTEPWKLSFKGKEIFSGPRFQAYREMFLNHLVHHRAQLGVYLRLTQQPVPGTYGPSADDTMGF